MENKIQDLNDLDKKLLIERIHKLEKELQKLKNNSPDSAKEDQNTEKNDKKFVKKKAPREFDFKKFKRRHIFIKFLYFGWNYNGYVVQDNTEQTVEACIYDALLKTRLIENRESCNMQRCGRTDKGVSAFSQVISVTVRSNLKLGDDLIIPENYIGPDYGTNSLSDEIDYIQALNGVLPKDIRVYAWAPLPSAPDSLPISARFDCRRRTYHYHCDKTKYDLKKMNLASKKLMGEHDFRNLCKMDVRNGVTNYVRKVYSAEVSDDGIFKIEASAFLYHQIRCIMTILMSIGSGLEDESIIDELLDIRKNPAKPQYPLADDLRLVLFDVCYDNIYEWQFGKNSSSIMNVIKILEDYHSEHSTKASIIKSMMNELSKKIYIQTIPAINGSDKYKPIMKRERCLSLEEALKKFNQNEQKKLKITQNDDIASMIE